MIAESEGDTDLVRSPTPEGSSRRAPMHPLVGFVARRVGSGVLTLLVASVLIYGAVAVLPGNVVQTVLGRNATPRLVATLDAQLHLNRSLPLRYFAWLKGIVTGHLGDSSAALAQGQIVGVGHAIAAPLRNTLILALVTIVLFIPLCIVLSVFSALHAGAKTDRAISVVTLALGSLPEFLVATLLILVFFSGLGLLPAVSVLSPGQSPLSAPSAMVLPVLTLLCVSVSFGTRLLRASLVEVFRENYVTAARLNGIRERRVVFRFALRNSLAPFIQVLAQMVQYLVGGLIVVESVFNYPGIGTSLVQAVTVRDPQMVSVIAMILATIYVTVNIAADLAVVLLVPRLRTQV